MGAKIENKLKSISDNESVYDPVHWFFKMITNKNDSHKWLLIRMIDFYWWW